MVVVGESENIECMTCMMVSVIEWCPGDNGVSRNVSWVLACGHDAVGTYDASQFTPRIVLEQPQEMMM